MRARIGAFWLLAALAVLRSGLAVGQPQDPMAGTPPSMFERMNQEAEVTLLRLYRVSPKAQALASRAFGALVVAAMRGDDEALGTAQGRGVLIDAVGRRTYYHVIASLPASVLGLKDKAVILLFSTSESLRAFQDAPGWVEGVNGTIQILDDTSMTGRGSRAVEPIVGFVLSETGLVSGLSLKGCLFIEMPIYLCADGAQACRAERGKP